MIETKEIQRKKMLEKLAKINEEERMEISKKLQQNLFETDLWKSARTIGVYLSMENEWDTYNIVERAFKDGKKVAIPKTIPDTKEMFFYRIDDLSQTVKGNFGLTEPDTHQVIILKKDEIELLLVPGLAFSKDGYRIGFGGGYYDRFLTDFVHPTISLAHSKQLLNKLGIEHFDVPVNYILTESGILGQSVEKKLYIWDNSKAKE